MSYHKSNVLRRSQHVVNTAYYDRKDLAIDAEGRCSVLCIDGKAHNFKQVKQNKYNDSYLFKVAKLAKIKLVTGDKLKIRVENVNTNNGEFDYFTRLFCGKCSGSIIIKLIGEGEIF